MNTVILHIPISLLELNTFGHAVCALLIYFLWWNKPFDVDYPTVIQSKTLIDIGLRKDHRLRLNLSPDQVRFPCST